jgi:hypothetical protein
MTPTEWKHRVAAIEALVGAPGMSGPVIINLYNDPERERAGPDETTIVGVLYQRGGSEPTEAFDARLKAAARAAGVIYVYVSMAQDYGLEEYRFGDDDPLGTIEIEGTREGPSQQLT